MKFIERGHTFSLYTPFSSFAMLLFSLSVSFSFSCMVCVHDFGFLYLLDEAYI